MTFLNPLTGSIAQSTQVQRQQSVDKDQQLRRVQEQSRNSAARNDQFEHSVESPEELTPLNDKQPQSDQRRRKQTKHHPDIRDDENDENPRLDLTA
jgi:hypothetical protein